MEKDIIKTESQHEQFKQKFIPELEKTVCELLGITPLELRSNYQYGQLGIARMIFIQVALRFGIDKKEIGEQIGFSRTRLIWLIKKGDERYIEIPAFKDVIDGLVSHFKKENQNELFLPGKI